MFADVVTDIDPTDLLNLFGDFGDMVDFYLKAAIRHPPDLRSAPASIIVPEHQRISIFAYCRRVNINVGCDV